MKKLILLSLVAPLMFLASCGPGNDITGTWSFSDVEFPAGKPADVTDEQVKEMKTMLKEMKYEFKDATHFTITGGMTNEPMKGTYKVAGDELKMKYEGAEKEQKFKIIEHASDKLVIEMVPETAPKDPKQRVAFVLTK